MKHIFTLIAVILSTALHAATALLPISDVVPIRWTVETSRANAAQFECFRGETLHLEATMLNYGRPLSIINQPSLYWQTNGMGNAWWTASAMSESNVVKATFCPTNDCGASYYNCFIGGPDSTYRAAFRLRMLPSPGFTPNVLPIPSVTYNAALFGEPTINGTNLTEWVTARSQAESDPVFSEWVRTNDFSSAGGSTGGVDTNAVLGLIASATNSITADDVGAIPDNGHVHLKSNGGSTGAWLEIDGDSSNGGSLFVNGGGQSGGMISVLDGGDSPASILKGGKEVATVDQIEQVNNTVSAWQTYWDGDDVRVTVTNYYGSAGLPSLYLEQKMPTNELHSTPWFKTIWDERTRWNSFLEGYLTITNTVANDLADRAWGIYDSSSGSYSPDGLLQLSQDQIMIASGMAYQKTVTAGGCAVWVLKSTSPTTISGVSSNGFFRIEDGDGNALFEIVKGDKRVVGATDTGVSMSGNTMTITYNSVSDEHPTLEVCTDLNASDWKTEADTTVATVSWGGSSGAWVATVTPVGSRSSLFAKATFEAGGNTYIKNNVASSLDKVVVGGVEYDVSVETVNGKKLLVLR